MLTLDIENLIDAIDTFLESKRLFLMLFMKGSRVNQVNYLCFVFAH